MNRNKPYLIAPCVHCGEERSINRPRGLCWKCYYTPGVKDRYPAVCPIFGRRGVPHPSMITEPDQPTDATPGTEEKIQVMAERAAAGQSLHHPDDGLRITEMDKPVGQHRGKRKPSC